MRCILHLNQQLLCFSNSSILGQQTKPCSAWLTQQAKTKRFRYSCRKKSSSEANTQELQSPVSIWVLSLFSKGRFRFETVTLRFSTPDPKVRPKLHTSYNRSLLPMPYHVFHCCLLIPRTEIIRAIKGHHRSCEHYFYGTISKEEEQLSTALQEIETLSRLPFAPFHKSGNFSQEKRETVSRGLMQKADEVPHASSSDRGVLLVPVIWGEKAGPPDVEKKGGLCARSKGSCFLFSFYIGNRGCISTEWERWIRDQQKSEGVTPGEYVYIILRLDGRVRRSGKGMPDWPQIVNELPPMEAFLSKLER
ncbi:hypothetical protein NC652_004872 [Populus alba x Populus x berolinensis]|nr:hypothetical protein NC652_004872 [Populus alba x Populus x berolinensis]